MIRKLVSLFTILLTTLMISSCQKTLEIYTYNYYDYMDTFITVSFSTYSLDEAELINSNVEDIFSIYHKLSNNYEGLNSTDSYFENIYTINEKVGQTLEIDEPLYHLLDQAKQIEILTDGYFDVTIGKAVDVWKNVMAGDYTDNTMSEEVYLSAINAINALDFTDNYYELTEADGHFYITTSGQDFKLDLGAIAKGYATQRVKEYLESEGIVYFYINSGSSSLYLGKNANVDRDYYNIGLTCPVCSTNGTYGTISNVMDESVTTSGDYEQYVLYNELRYHHIISPMTKMPMQYYHSVTLVGADAGMLDALTTALFSMPEDVMNAWMESHSADLNLSIVYFKYDESIVDSLLGNLIFEAN